MAVSDEYLEFVLDQFSELGGVSAKKMFGGAGLYFQGGMFALIADDVLYLKADENSRQAFEEAGSRQFRPWADKPMMMPYWETPPEVLEDPSELALWALRSIACRKGK